MTAGRGPYLSSVKGAAIRRDRYAALCVDDERRRYAYVVIEGPASYTEEHDERLDWSTRIGERYVGPGDGARAERDGDHVRLS